MILIEYINEEIGVKKYLGTKMNAFCAVIAVVICFLPIAVGAFVLKSYSGIGAKAVFAFCIAA